MRPQGEIARALVDAAGQEPGTVLQLAHRAQVSVPVARYTASRLLERGDLRVVQPGRPAVLASSDLALEIVVEREQQAEPLLLHSLWWCRPSA